MNDSPKANIAPEIPEELEDKLETLNELDPSSGQVINKNPSPKRDTKEFFKKLAATCKKLKLGTDKEGLPWYEEGKYQPQEVRNLMAECPKGYEKLMDYRGDLSPAFVEAFYLFDPSKAACRYYGRPTHLAQPNLFR